MGSPNPAFERAASFFHGHFEGLGYEAHIMRVTDHLNPTQPESLNIIAWKDGRNGDCVQGMGAHMDIAPPGGPPGGGTYEGAYDNNGWDRRHDAVRTRRLSTSSLNATHSSLSGRLKKKDCEDQTHLPTTIATTAFLKTKNYDFTSTWT